MSTNRKKKCQKSSMIHKSIVYIQCDKWLQYHNLSNACFKGLFFKVIIKLPFYIKKRENINFIWTFCCCADQDWIRFNIRERSQNSFLFVKNLTFNKRNILLQFARLWLHQQHAIKQTILWFQPYILYSLGYQMLNWCLM